MNRDGGGTVEESEIEKNESVNDSLLSIYKA